MGDLRAPEHDLGDGLGQQRRYFAQLIEVSVSMEHRDIVAQCAGRNKAIDGRSDRETVTLRGTVKLSSLYKKRLLHGRFDNGQGKHGIPGSSIGPFLSKPLEDLLDHRKAGDHLVELERVFDPVGILFSENSNPH